jgi:hypothetical protein
VLDRALTPAPQWSAWGTGVDVGDHVAAEGEVVATRRGTVSVQVASWTMATKALRPLPGAAVLGDGGEARDDVVHPLEIPARRRIGIVPGPVQLRALHTTGRQLCWGTGVSITIFCEHFSAFLNMPMKRRTPAIATSRSDVLRSTSTESSSEGHGMLSIQNSDLMSAGPF